MIINVKKSVSTVLPVLELKNLLKKYVIFPQIISNIYRLFAVLPKTKRKSVDINGLAKFGQLIPDE